MPALPDWMKQNIKFAYGGLGAPFAALDIKGILDSDNKFKALAKTIKDLVLIRVSLVGTFMAIGAAVKALVKDTGSLDAALKRLSEVQHFQRLFTPFVGGAKAARKEVSDLLQFAAHTPFKFEGVAHAALTLQTLSRGQFAGEPALKKLGDAAAVSGNSIEESAKAVGAFYEALHNGEPINQSVESMRQMGLISTMAATNLDRLAQSGGNAQAMASQLTSALSESRGGMREFANDLESVAAAREKAVEGAKVAFGAPFTEREVQTTKNYTEAIVAITPALSRAGNVLSAFVGGIEKTTSSFVKWIAQSGIGAKAIELVTGAVVALTVALTTIGIAAIPGFIGFIAKLMVGVEGATAGMGALGVAIRAVASIAAGGLIAAPLIGAGVAVLGLGVALYQVTQRSKEFKKALAEEMAAHGEVVKNIQAHIAAIQTLADKYQVVSEAVQQTIKDQKDLNDLIAKRTALQVEIGKTADPGIRASKERDLAEIEQRIEQQRRKIDIDRKTRQRAEQAPAIAGPEREALIQLQTRRQLLLEEQRLEEEMARQPGRAPELLRERAGVLDERARRGRAGVEAREQIELRRSELAAGRGEFETAIAGQEQQLAELAKQKGTKEQRKRLKEQIAINQAALDKIDADILKAGLAGGETSVGLETRAQQLQHAINAKAAQERGQKDIAEREKTLAGGVVAGPNAPAQLLELQTRTARAKQIEAQAPEAEIEARRKITEAQEAERGRFVTELQTHIERAIVTASRTGTPGQRELLTDLHSFISHFEDLRKIFPDPKAAQLAMEKVGTDIMNFPAEALKPVADSLTRVGGGGGVGGPTGDPRLIAQQRMNTLQATANSYLRQIEANTAKGTQPSPAPTTGAAIPGGASIEATGVIPGGRIAGVGESQELVNQIEKNRLAAEGQPVQPALGTGIVPEHFSITKTPFVMPESASAQPFQMPLTASITKQPFVMPETASTKTEAGRSAEQMVESFKDLGNIQFQAPPAIPVTPTVPVIAPMPQPAPTPEITPQTQTNSILQNIYHQNKQSNDHLSLVADNTKGAQQAL